MLLLSVSSCVSAPRQTVELSEIVDKQIAEMQLSHEKFVRLYYQKCRDEIDVFMVEKWIPEFLSTVVSGESDAGAKFRKDLTVAYSLSDFDWKSAVNVNNISNQDLKNAIINTFDDLARKNNASLGKVLIEFSEAAQEQINKRRDSLIKPIDEQEGFVLNELRDSYSDLLRSSASIKGYLSSAVDVVEQQDQILEKIGVLDEKKKIVDKALELNDKAIELLKRLMMLRRESTNFFLISIKSKKKLKNLRIKEISNAI